MGFNSIMAEEWRTWQERIFLSYVTQLITKQCPQDIQSYVENDVQINIVFYLSECIQILRSTHPKDFIIPMIVEGCKTNVPLTSEWFLREAKANYIDLSYKELVTFNALLHGENAMIPDDSQRLAALIEGWRHLNTHLSVQQQSSLQNQLTKALQSTYSPKARQMTPSTNDLHQHKRQRSSYTKTS